VSEETAAPMSAVVNLQFAQILLNAISTAQAFGIGKDFGLTLNLAGYSATISIVRTEPQAQSS
jgi:hypothetical protein